MFLAQLESSLSMLATDDSDESSDDEDSGGDPMAGVSSMYGMSNMESMLPALTAAGVPASTISSMMGGGSSEANLFSSLSASTATIGASAIVSPAGATRGAKENAQVVASVAAKVGVDPVTAVAMMLVESGGNNRAVGDGGTSFGLFQLHEGGMLTSAGLTRDQAFDPATNAAVSLRSLKHQFDIGPNRSPGEIAAASQRPADQVGYAQKVNATMDRARQLLGLSS
jgi:hypothetical protein